MYFFSTKKILISCFILCIFFRQKLVCFPWSDFGWFCLIWSTSYLFSAVARIFMENLVKTMAADALSPCINRSLSAMVFPVKDRCVLVFHKERFHLSVPIYLWWTNVNPDQWSHMAPLGLNELTHWGRDKIAAISQTIFWNTFSWMKMCEFRLRFHWSLFLRVQLTMFQHWFR